MRHLSLLYLLVFSQQLVIAQCHSWSLEVVEHAGAEIGILGAGDFWWDLNDALYNIPVREGSDELVNIFFAGGLWLGGVDQGGDLHIAASTYRQSGLDFWPGPLDENTGEVFADGCEIFDRHWKVSRKEIIEHQCIHPDEIAMEEIPEAILTWPAKGNPHARGVSDRPLNITQDLAPFVDVNYDGIYNATHGDFPKVPGDQAVFWVFNDYTVPHTVSGAQPLKTEVHGLAYFYEDGGYLDQTSFYRFDFINRSELDYHSMYCGIWTDVDVGAFDDDFIGYDSLRNLAIAYNGDGVDGPTSPSFGDEPPIVGIDWLRGPETEKGSGVYSRTSSFIYYDGGWSISGHPHTASDYYNYLRGQWKDGVPITFGGGGYGGSTPYPFMYPDPPSEPLPSWSECSEGNDPFDRRLLMNGGPFSWESGEKISVHFSATYVRPEEPQIGCAADWNLLFQAEAQIQGIFDSYIAPGAWVDDLILGDDLNYAVLEKVELYPNPAKDLLRIDFAPRNNQSGNNGDRWTFHILDQLGRERHHYELDQAGKQEIKIDLEAGTFVAELRKDQKPVEQKILLVQH